MNLLVITNETAEGDVLFEVVAGIAARTRVEVLVVAPALNSRLRHWLSDVDGARAAAAVRLARCVERLRARGIAAEGEIGDADPIQAIEDALATLPADELVIATHPEERSNWLAHDLVGRACERFALPVAHVVVDLPAPNPRGEPDVQVSPQHPRRVGGPGGRSRRRLRSGGRGVRRQELVEQQHVVREIER
jgi:hypothetical protein